MCEKRSEWVVTFSDCQNSFRICDNSYYTRNQKPDVGNGMREMDFCYCNKTSIDLIECKESINPDRRKLKENCVDKALHSVAFLKTALYLKDNDLKKEIDRVGVNYNPNIILNLYFIFKVQEADKNTFPDVAKYIEDNVMKFLVNPFGRIWNIGRVKVYTYNSAKNKLNYISGEDRFLK